MKITRKREQWGWSYFCQIDQKYYFDEGRCLRYLTWKYEREAAPMHQPIDEVCPHAPRGRYYLAADGTMLKYTAWPDKEAAPMHQPITFKGNKDEKNV